MNFYYRQPRYFNDFHCIGSECRNNCCYGWTISWEKDEVEKVINAETITPDLKNIIEKSFIPDEKSPGHYKVQFNEQGKCPCVTEDGLCRIQKELGAEYLSNTCMSYPRNYIVINDVIYRFCNTSCYVVMDRLLNVEKSMDLVNCKTPAGTIIHPNINDSPKSIEMYPEIKYRGQLLEFFYELIGDKKHDVETNIILGALAAQSLTKLVEKREYGRIPEALKSFKAQMHDGAQLKAIENIKPNYHLRFGFIGKILDEIIGTSPINSLRDPTGTPNVVLYELGSRLLMERFKDRPFFMRNIALNLLFELAVPFKFLGRTIFENYSLFAVAYACLKLDLIAAEIAGKSGNVEYMGQHFHYEGEERFSGLASIICRGLCQNRYLEQNLLTFLKEHNFTTPAYLALLVK